MPPPNDQQNQPRITEQEVRHVAKLARLAMSDDDVHHFTGQLADVLNYVAKLDELDVENVQPLAHVMERTNVMREDVEQPGLAVDVALTNAPKRDGAYFEVPKVLGEASGA